MQTLSIHITEINENDESLCYYDELSLLIIQIIKQMKLYGVKLINITDYFGDKSKDNIKEIIDLYKEKETLIFTTVEINQVEFNPELICTNEVADKIQEALNRDTSIMRVLGFSEISHDLFNINSITPFIYPNDIGVKVIDFINELKSNISEE